MIKPQHLKSGDTVAVVSPSWDREALQGRLKDLFARELGRPHVPVVTEMDFGHTDPMVILPHGGRAVVDAERREVSLPDQAVV